MVGRLRLAGTAVVAAIALLILLPFHLIGLAVGGQAAGALTARWHRIVVFLLGVKVTVIGAPAGERPLLLLSNHMSWLDIPVLASLAPMSFVAKQEVAAWPIVGWLARLQRSVFVDRTRRQATRRQTAQIAARLARGDVLVLFAEGTSGDGNRVLPFRSALVGAAQQAAGADGGPVTVQSVAIAYPGMLGLPLGRQHRPLVAWYGDTDLLPHLSRIMSTGAIDAQVVFGPARRLSRSDSRKLAAAEAERFARDAVAAINAGRDPADCLAELALPTLERGPRLR